MNFFYVPDGLLKSLAKSGGYTAFTLLVSYLMLAWLARSQEPLEFSAYLYNVSIALVAYLLIDLASEHTTSHAGSLEAKSLNEFTSRLLVIRFILLCVCTCVVSVSWWGGFLDDAYSIFLLLPALSMAGHFQASGKNVDFARIMLFEKLLFILSTYFILTHGFKFEYIYFAFFLSTLISIVLQLQFFSFSVKDLIKNNFIENYFRNYWPIYILGIAQFAYGGLSRFFIADSLGLLVFANFVMAYQIINIFAVFQRQVDRHFRPIVHAALAGVDPTAVIPIIRFYCLFYLAPLLVMVGILIFFSDALFSTIYGENWPNGGVTLAYMAPLVLTIAAYRFCDNLMMGLAKTKANLAISSFCSLFMIIIFLVAPSSWSIFDYIFLLVGTQISQVILLIVFSSAILRRKLYT